MTALSEKERSILEHAVAWRSKNRCYRNNYYLTGEECDSWPACMALVERGLMGRRGPVDGIIPGYIFFVTEAGLEVLKSSEAALAMTPDEAMRELARTKVATPEMQDVLFDAGLLRREPFAQTGWQLTRAGWNAYARARGARELVK